MAEMITPGVFTEVFDKTYIPQGVGEIGAAFVGPTQYGQAFVPTTVNSYTEFQQKFGGSYDESYLPIAVRNYLKYKGTATIVRTLGLDGYESGVLYLVASSSDATYHNKVVAAFHPSRYFTTVGGVANMTGSITASPISGALDFTLTVSASQSTLSSSVTYSNLSLSPTSANYFGNVFPETVRTSAGSYLYTFNETFAQQLASASLAGGTASLFLVNTDTIDLSGSGYGEYADAETPWITSQTVAGNVTNLFKIHTFAHGESANKQVKIAISNIKVTGEIPGTYYGSFSVLVRSIDDSDKSPNILEQFNDCNLDPDSPNYICRVIGDKHSIYQSVDGVGKIINLGDYNNNSAYIYVEVTDDVKYKTLPATLIPWGYKAPIEPLDCGVYTFPTASNITAQTSSGQPDTRIYFGFNYDFDATDNDVYLNPIPDGADAGGNTDFNLANTPISLTPSTSVPNTSRKFVVPMQGGFSGISPAIKPMLGTDSGVSAGNTLGYDFTNASSVGNRIYARAMSLLSNSRQYDINMLVTPGLYYSLNSAAITYGIDMCETRGDAFYVFDSYKYDYSTTMATIVNTVQAVDSNLSATYHPWIKTFDSELNKYMWVPPSVLVASAYAQNDKIGYEWYAPAGFNRGSLATATDVFPLAVPETNTLYTGRINPIINDPIDGITVWGQKTLQSKPSALDRVNVSRLIINLKKYVASVGKYLVFEQNVSATRNSFLNDVNPYMNLVKERAGLYIYKVVMDETNNTNDIIDKNILYGQIWIQPTKTAEFVKVDFNVTPTGATFEI